MIKFDAYEAVVLAANGLSTAAISANTDDADRIAGEADEDVRVARNDAEEAKQRLNRAGIFLGKDVSFSS